MAPWIFLNTRRSDPYERHNSVPDNKVPDTFGWGEREKHKQFFKKWSGECYKENKVMAGVGGGEEVLDMVAGKGPERVGCKPEPGCQWQDILKKTFPGRAADRPGQRLGGGTELGVSGAQGARLREVCISWEIKMDPDCTGPAGYTAEIGFHPQRNGKAMEGFILRSGMVWFLFRQLLQWLCVNGFKNVNLSLPPTLPHVSVETSNPFIWT